jgi:hypothetical protein
MIMETYVSAAEMLRNPLIYMVTMPSRKPRVVKSPPPQSVPDLITATPAWAWELHHHRGIELRKVAAKLGVSMSAVFELLAAEKPRQDALKAKRMKMAPEPRAEQVSYHSGLLEMWERTGATGAAQIGIDEDTATSAADHVAFLAGRQISFHVETGEDGVATLWLWQTDAADDDQQRTAVGIEVSRRSMRILDGWRNEIGTAGNCAWSRAETLAAEYMRKAAMLEAA